MPTHYFGLATKPMLLATVVSTQANVSFTARPRLTIVAKGRSGHFGDRRDRERGDRGDRGERGERGHHGRGEKEKRDKIMPQSYRIRIVTPPPRELGSHMLPPNTQCGEMVDIEGEQFIVAGVTYQYRLRKGKYEPAEKRLDVQSCGRYIVNVYLQSLLEKS